MPLSAASAPSRELSAAQIESIRAMMRLVVEEDIANGLPPHARMYCDACQQSRPCPGLVRYGRYEVCNSCATEYEVARACTQVMTAGQFVRDKRFGEGERYRLPATAGQPARPSPARPSA